MNTWRLYVKWPGQDRFRPVDWKKGTQVMNLIHATLFNDIEASQVKADLRQMQNENEGMEWKFAKVHTMKGK